MAGNLRRAYEAGVRIAFGTDQSGWSKPHGMNALELQYMVEAGMQPMDVLLSATSGHSGVRRRSSIRRATLATGPTLLYELVERHAADSADEAPHELGLRAQAHFEPDIARPSR